MSRTEHDGETADTVFFLYDANCNVNAIVNEDGELVKTFDYEEFGGEHPASVAHTYLTNQNAENDQLRFAGGVGHPTDDSGLVYMRARYYDPASGRFISEDPGRNGTNWYAYCGNNPVNMIDHDGQMAAWVALGIIGGLASLWGYLGYIAITGKAFSPWAALATFAVGFGVGAIGGVMMVAWAGAQATWNALEIVVFGLISIGVGSAIGMGIGVMENLSLSLSIHDIQLGAALADIDSISDQLGV